MYFIMSFQRKKWKTKAVLNFLYIRGWRSHLIILKLMDPWIINPKWLQKINPKFVICLWGLFFLFKASKWSKRECFPTWGLQYSWINFFCVYNYLELQKKGINNLLCELNNRKKIWLIFMIVNKYKKMSQYLQISFQGKRNSRRLNRHCHHRIKKT